MHVFAHIILRIVIDRTSHLVQWRVGDDRSRGTSIFARLLEEAAIRPVAFGRVYLIRRKGKDRDKATEGQRQREREGEREKTVAPVRHWLAPKCRLTGFVRLRKLSDVDSRTRMGTLLSARLVRPSKCTCVHVLPDAKTYSPLLLSRALLSSLSRRPFSFAYARSRARTHA